MGRREDTWNLLCLCSIDPMTSGCSPAFMLARCFMLLLLGTSCCWAQTETAVTGRLKAEFQAAYAYAPPTAVEEKPELSGEPVLELEPMVVTRSLAFGADILAEARRATEAKKAKEFSILRGGSLLSFRRGDIGFWPKIVPVDATPVKKGDVAISVDLLRLKW